MALLAQGAVHSVHSDVVLVREDTRNQTRDWMLANVPRGSEVFPIRVAPRRWFRDDEGERAWKRFPLYRVVQERDLRGRRALRRRATRFLSRP